MKNSKILFLVLAALLVTTFCFSTSSSWFASTTSSKTDLTASIQRSYFESGDGSKENPYEIRRPMQVYYFSWLQQMGYFNREDENNPGTVDQTYFYLSSDIDMTGFTIPPIGTAKYPFVGGFDGRGHVISNIVINNDDDQFAYAPDHDNYSENADQVIGFFGVVGSMGEDGLVLDGGSDTPQYLTYSSQENSISNFCLDSVLIASEKPKDNKTLIGIVAGYVNADISNVAVCNSGVYIASGVSAIGNTLYTHASEYSMVGYCTEDCLSNLQVVDVAISDVLLQGGNNGGSSGGTGPGGEPVDDTSGNAWGGSINMKTLYNRLYDIYENRADSESAYYESETRYQYIGAPELNTIDDRSGGGNVNGGLSGTGIGSGVLEVNKFRVFDQNYDEGVATFSRSLFDNGESYIYLMGEIDDNFEMQDGESQYINKVITVHTLEKQNATGMYIYNGNNYLSVQEVDGTPTLVNVTNRASASVWFKVTTTGGVYLFTQIGANNYYLSFTVPTYGLPTLSVVTESSGEFATWNVSGNVISTVAKNVARYWYDALTNRQNITVYLKYQEGWVLVEDTAKSLFITDGTNYLTYTANGSNLSVANTTNKSKAASWVYDTSTANIYLTYQDVQYYLVNNNGQLQIVAASSVTSSMKISWTTGTSGDNNYIKNSLNGYDYSILYDNGWYLQMDSTYKIHYGSYYLQATTSSTLIKSDSASATAWTLSSGASGGVISTRISGATKYLAVKTVSGSVKLVLDSSTQTVWRTSVIPDFYGVTVYSFITTYNGTDYYLLCENGTWRVAAASEGRYVVGYKYSFVANTSKGYDAIWLSHNMSTDSGENFTTTTSLETAPIFYLNSSNQLYVMNGSTKLYLGISWARLCSIHSESMSRTIGKLDIAYNDDGSVRKIKVRGSTSTYELNCNGDVFQYYTTSKYIAATIVRPPMAIEQVATQNIRFLEDTGSMAVEELASSYYKEVKGSPKTTSQNTVSKLVGTYVPLNVIVEGDSNYVPLPDGSTSYITSQRNTGYIISGSNYQKYDSYSTYRLGDVRVANYELDELNSEYFNTSTKEILKVFTSNSYGADQEYDMTNGSSYFNKSFPKIQQILQTDGNMYGIHFMDAKVSSDRTITAEKAIIEHVSYYDYEMPESCINVNLMYDGYINFFAGTYANDVFVGDNDSFFTLYQVFRYKDSLPDSAIVAVYTCEGRPNVLKMNNEKYYYYDTSASKLTYIKNIDNIFSTGKSLDDLYLQVTSNVYMNPSNPSGTLYYTLRNDVRDGYYYTYNMTTQAFTEYYSANLSGYKLATEITSIKQIKKIYSRYTSAGASSLATRDMVYFYSDGTYSRTGVTENNDGSVTLNSIKYNLVFDLNWIDTETDLITDAIYYFEIPVMAGEYCLGSVEGGRGAYLLYLDVSTNSGSGTDEGTTNEIAIVETKTTKIETYKFVKGISIVESTDDFTSVPDYETLNMILSNSGNYIFSREGDNIIVRSANGIIVYVGYGLLANGADPATIFSAVPYKTTIIVEETSTIKKTSTVDGTTTVSTDTYVQSNCAVVYNQRVALTYDSVVLLTAWGVSDQTFDLADPDEAIVDVNVTLTTNNSFELTTLNAEILNTTSNKINVKLVDRDTNPTYEDGQETKSYTITITPSTLSKVGDKIVLE